MELLVNTVAHSIFYAAISLIGALAIGQLVPGIKVFTLRKYATLKSKVKAFAKCHPSAAIVLVGLALWFSYGPVVHLFTGDGPDGPALMDVGVFQTLLLAGVRAVALYCFARLLLFRYMAVIAKFLFGFGFQWAFKHLSAWQKVIAALWALSLFVFLVTQLTR
jgi:hypothetical protein